MITKSTTRDRFATSYVIINKVKNDRQQWALNWQFIQNCFKHKSLTQLYYYVQNKGQSNLANGDITWLISQIFTQSGRDGVAIRKRYLVDIFYHIRQVAARVANLVLGKGRSLGSVVVPFVRAIGSIWPLCYLWPFDHNLPLKLNVSHAQIDRGCGSL